MIPTDFKPIEDQEVIDDLLPTILLSRDLRQAMLTLGPSELRYLVDFYYQAQRDRTRAANQVRSIEGEPHRIITWLTDNTKRFEGQIKAGLDAYTNGQPLGRWCKSIIGIGPVIAAGLMAHIDITKAPTVGHIWRFAGLDPTIVWKSGQKRPWNARLKTLAWKAGESFVKFQNHPNDIYGKLFVHRKGIEAERNESGDFEDQARRKLETTNIGKDTEAYKWYSQGKLPPAHIHARAVRWTAKLFLAHFHHVAYELEFGTEPPKPYVISIQGHQDFIGPPNWPLP